MFSLSKQHSHTPRRPALAIATAILILLNSFPLISMPSAVARPSKPAATTKNVAAKGVTTTAATAAPGTNVLIPSAGTPVTQNFNTLASTGTSSTVPADWAFVETGTAANTTYTAGTGSLATGDTYSFGATSSTERAFGTLLSGSLVSTIGAAYTNNVGATITQLLISYNGEQWRLGATGRVDRLDFQYSTNATSLTTGTWVDADTLDFTAPVTAGTVGALDGNAAANRTAISNTISGLNIPNGATFWIRWNDLNATGSDDGLAVDDFSLTANGGPVTPVISIGDVSAAEGNSGTTAFNFQVTLTAPAPAGGVTFNYATADGTATVANNDYNQITTTGGTIAAGNTSTTVTVFVNGDTTTEPNETFFVNLSNISPNATAGDLQGQGTINNDDVTLTGICTIQGNGATSTYNGQNVSTTGVVTGIKAGSSGGYYIQDDACDADPTTSNGIFVFTGATVPAAAVVGNLVQVTGTIQEFIPSADLFQKPLTEFTSGSSAIVLGTQALPTPVTITAADTQVNDLNNLEKYEGMRVAVPSLTVVGPTQGSITEPGATVTSNGVFFGVVTGVLRPFREAGINVSDPLPPGAPATVTRFDENPERIRVDSDGQPGTTALDVAAGTIITNLVGELDYSFRAYTVLPEPANPPTVGTQPGPTAVPTPLPSELTVASFNMERFFDTVNDPSTSDPVLTTSAYNRRVAKASLIIRTLQHYPDVIGVEEMENLSTLQNVAAQVNSDAVNLDSLPNPQYVAYLIEGSDIGGIDVGFLVKSSRVTVGSVTQIELPGCDHVTPSTCNNYTDPNDGSLDILNDRPPLVLQATIPRTDNTPFAFTVIVNHMRSLSGVDDPTVAGTGTVGARVREKRRKGAEFLANYIQSRQTADPNERLITVGDLNAFRVSDGYVDVIGTLLGTPTPANQVTLASPDLVNPNQIDLVDTLPAAQQYSYNFDGNAQTLDHIIVNPNANSSLNRFAYVRNDSDFPVKNYESTNALRISDHDQPVAYFNLAPAVTPPVCATNVAASSYGATATASSTINANHPASGAIDGNHTSWASGAGWNDGTANAYPDDLTINLGTSQQISEVDVYSLQDNYSSPVEPGDAMTFNYYGLTSFEVQVPDGVGGWMTVPGGNITGNNLVRRRVVFGSPVTTSQIRIKVNSTADGVYTRIVEVEAFSCTAVPVPTPTPTPAPCNTNVAAGAYGASASASSEAGPGYAASGAIDGNHTGAGWGSGVGWNDGTAGVFPDNLVINLGVTQALSEIDVYSLQDNYNSPIEPTDTTTFTAYGLTNFQVQIPDGVGGWLNVPGGNIVGNNLVKRKVIFASPVNTSQIRILVTASADGVYSRVVEVEAFSCTAVPGPTPTPTPAPCTTNVAASSYGTSATASSEFSAGYPAAGAIDGNHVGNPWGGGAGWNDGTAFVFPDTLTIDLVATQQLSEIDVYSLQDDYNNPVEPTDSMTFTYYGLVDFQVQIPNGLGGWVDVPGGHAVLNNLVKRKFVFGSPVTTNMIRIVVNNSSDAQYSRVVEVEAFSCDPVPTRCVNNGGTNGCSSTIQGAINAAPPNVPITVYPGTYDEDVNVNKPGIRLLGSGAGSTNIRGTMADATTSTVAITASNVTVAGFTITRLGNNTTDWNNNLNVAGISIQGQAVTNALVRDNIFTGNRNGIDVNDSSGHTFRNNVIDFNRTGFIFRNRTDNETVVENFITNNWTVGVLFLDASGGTNSPVQSALHSTFSNNNISANWYGQIADRQSGGSLPAPGTTNLKNFRGNWFGTTSPVITTANTTEPGYAAQIPTAYGGSATAPGGQPDVAGPASANLKIDPILLSGTDTNVETTAGRGTFGFQGAPNTLVSPANQRNWAFFDDFGSGTGSGGFEAGPGTPPLGTGSAFLTVDGTARYAFEVFTHYAGTRMDDITTLQYRSYQDNNANTVLAISLQFDIDYDLTDANNNFQGRLVFEPYMSGTVQQNTWQTWDARAGNWYASNTGAGGSNGLCPQNAPCTWAQVLTSFPNAGIRNTPAGGVLFKAGGPWSPGFDGNVDAFKIGINSFRTTYDFEPAP